MGEPRNLKSHNVSPFQRRSGIAISLVCDVLDWAPDTIIQIGCGSKNDEAHVFYDAWPEVRLIGFEPNPKNYNWLKGKFPKAEFHQIAVGSYTGTATMYEKHRHGDGSSLFPFEDANIKTKSFQVPITTLDALFPEGPPSNQTLLWLDCEGCELDVLRYGQKTLDKTEIVNVELTARPFSKEWSTMKDVHAFLMEAGFKRQWLSAQRISRGQVDSIFVRPKLFRPEYCICPCQLEGSCGGLK